MLGLFAFSIALIRRRAGVRVMVWLAFWSSMFGLNELASLKSTAAALPASLHPVLSALVAVISYLLLIFGTLSFYEKPGQDAPPAARAAVCRYRGRARLTPLFRHRSTQVHSRNILLAALTLAVLVIVVAIPRLSQKYMVVAGHRVLTVGTFLFGRPGAVRQCGKCCGLEPVTPVRLNRLCRSPAVDGIHSDP